MRFMHWFMALYVFFMLIAGFSMKRLFSEPFKWTVYPVHKAFGLCFLVLILMRLLMRHKSIIPKYSKKIQKFKFFSISVHHSMYLLMLLMPITGYVMSSASNKAINIFSIHIPLLIKKSPYIATMSSKLHTVFSFLIVILIALHIVGTLYHLIFDKENLFKRMI